MYATIQNKYGEAESYAKPVVSQPIPKDIFMGYIREVVEKEYDCSNVTRNNLRMRANILEHYLNKYEINDVVPDEQFIKVMWDRLKESGDLKAKEYQWETRKKAPRFTRELINEFLYPKGLVQRQVLKDIISQRYEKFFELTPNSREAVKWFEENGKRVEAIPVYVENTQGDISNQLVRMLHRVTNRELKPVTKSGKVEHALRFLKAVNKNGFEFITDEDVKKYEAICLQRGVKQKEDYLAHVATFFINIRSQGFIKTNPLSHVSLKMNGGAIKKDFITVEGMEKFKDLSTLNYKNKEDVRDRLVVMLSYDLALRISELHGLEVADFRKDEQGEWFVTLRPEIQKGHKDEEVMYLFFDETKQLLEHYLKSVRKQFGPTTDALILSNQRGRALSTAHCATRFKMLCQRFAVQTYYGEKPSPHTLRHTFATLNIETIGLCLPLYETAQRLRHSKVETTRRHYIHNNPYLKKLKMEAHRKNNKKKTPKDVLNEMPLPEIEHWLSDTVGIDSSTIRHIRENYKKVFNETPVDKKVIDNKIYVPETEVMERLGHLNLQIPALRQYANKHGYLEEGIKGTARDGSWFRYGNGFKYDAKFIEDLAQNWIPADSLQKRLGWERNLFYRRLDSEKWRSLKIGYQRLIHKLDCV